MTENRRRFLDPGLPGWRAGRNNGQVVDLFFKASMVVSKMPRNRSVKSVLTGSMPKTAGRKRRRLRRGNSITMVSRMGVTLPLPVSSSRSHK